MKIPFPFLLLVLFLSLTPSLTFSQSLRGTLIDCGATIPSVISGLQWVSDDDFITTGTPKNLSIQYQDLTLSTVRTFPVQNNVFKKFCYEVPVFRTGKYLVRTTYFYGGVNGNVNPPVFDQMVDGTFWSVVNTTEDYVKGNASFYEGIFLAAGKTMSVCLAANNYTDSDPFISALEVVLLANSLYNSTDFGAYALKLVARHSFGYNGPRIRYPDDQFDRYWLPFGEDNSTTPSFRNVSVSGFWNIPPLKVFQTHMGINQPKPLELHWPPTSLKNSIYYIALYFADDRVSPSGSARMFNITVNGVMYYSNLFVTEAGAAVFANQWPLSGFTNITLTPTGGSTIGPLINAGEVFEVLNLGGRTLTRDVIAMERLKASFQNPPFDWNGDPCLPRQYSWTGVTCSEGPRAFSISWSRILPTGKKESRNQKGIDFYKGLLTKLEEQGIEPFVTLLHFDPPQALEDEYGGFLSSKIVDDFCEYARICFDEFGDQVKYWITINEPWSFAYGGYATGKMAPGLRTVSEYSNSSSTKQNYSSFAKRATPGEPTLTSDDGDDDEAGSDVDDDEAGSDVDDDEATYDEEASIFPPSQFSFPPSKNVKNSYYGIGGIPRASFSQEVPAVVPSEKVLVDPKYPYLVAHHQILAHAKAVKLYRDNYKCCQKGKIGIVLVSQLFIPFNKSKKHQEAAQRATDFMLGWFLDPLVRGEYPENMRKYVTKGYLPEFKKNKYMVRGSFDFIGLNYYTARYVTRHDSDGGNFVADQRVKFHVKRGGVNIGEEQGAAGWIYAYPRGLMDLLVYIKEKYNNPLIYITENGIDDPDDNSSTHWKSFFDQRRILFLHDHLSYVGQAKRRGVNVKGYFVWSLLDNFEWASGFTSRFGITYIDYENGSKRCPKYSASWLKCLLET